MINFSSLSYRYPDAVASALDEIDISIHSNEILLLTGMSGSGKSTFLRVINGLVPHFFGGVFSGEAVIDGHNTRTSSPTKLSAVVGTVFQEPNNRFLTSSVEDEVAFGLEVSGIPGREIHQRVREIIERFELGSLMDRKLDQLSAGEQQRVAVAAALGRIPKVLLLDEPTSQLDRKTSRAVLDWVFELQKEFELTTVISEHRMDRLIRIVDRIAYLAEDGKLQIIGSPAEVLPQIPIKPSFLRAMEQLGISPDLSAEKLRDLKKLLSRGLPKSGGLSLRGQEPLLATNDLHHNYNGIPALKKVELKLFPGEIAALIGHNGAGKSTLLRCLMGLITPDKGEVILEGKSMRSRQVGDFAQKVAYVPQWPSALLFADSVEEELSFTLKNHGIELDPPILPNELLAQFGLLELRHRYPRDLSAGQRQRVALASVLITKPNIILLDEPTLGMDPLAQDNLSKLLKSWTSQGAAILVATHDVEFAAAHADRVIILERGAIEADGPTAETLFTRSDYQTALQQLTGGPWPASPEQLDHA
ncbi:MAG: ATP-binding cassette domain-containing protein [Anaerolineales bacterium]